MVERVIGLFLVFVLMLISVWFLRRRFWTKVDMRHKGTRIKTCSFEVERVEIFYANKKERD